MSALKTHITYSIAYNSPENEANKSIKSCKILKTSKSAQNPYSGNIKYDLKFSILSPA